MTRYFITYTTGYTEEVSRAVAEAALANPYVATVTEDSDDFQLEDLT